MGLFYIFSYFLPKKKKRLLRDTIIDTSNATVKQNFRNSSGSFASPKHYPSLEVQCWALCKSIWISYGPLYSMRISTWKPECKKDGDLDSDFEQ